MVQNKLAAIVKNNRVDRFRHIIDEVTRKIPKINIEVIEYKKMGNDYLITFTFQKKYFEILIKILTFNHIELLSTNDKVLDLVDSFKKESKSFSNSPGFKEIMNESDAKKRYKSIPEYIETGNYHKIIQMSKDINLDKKLAENAKNQIPVAVMKAVELNIEKAENKENDAGKYINNLVEIAVDQKLKGLGEVDLIRDAGIAAIDLCLRDKKYFYKLIEICNNNQLNSLVNIKAAVKMAEKTLHQTEFYEKELAHAVKNLNIRWLSIVLDIVYKDLSKSEVELFEELYSYIRKNRK